MKSRPCSYISCGNRRIHHERQDEMRGQQLLEVPDDYPDTDPVYCSTTCGLMDGWLTLKYETREENKARIDKWYRNRKLKCDI